MHATEPWILTSLFSGKLYIWNYNTGDVVRQWDVTSTPVRACKFIERKQWVIVGCDDLKIRVYNYNTAEKVAVLVCCHLGNRVRCALRLHSLHRRPPHRAPHSLRW